MKVIWKYDPLFSFKVFYPKKLNPNDFVITPSHTCKKLLDKYHLIFKKSENGGTIISEKRINDDQTVETVFRINTLTAFNFILQLKNSLLFSHIDPYSNDPEAELPEYFGRRRFFYFDNLNESLEIDQTIIPISEVSPTVEMNEMDIAVNSTAGSDDLASLVENEFTYTKRNGVTDLVFSPVRPIPNDNITFNLSATKPAANVALATGAYEFEQVGSGNPKETIYAGSEFLGESSFAIIQVYKNEFTDYAKAIRYNIKLEET